MHLGHYTNVTQVVSGVVNGLVDHYGSLYLQMFVLGLLPRSGIEQQQLVVLKEQNQSLFKVVCALICKKRYPTEYIPPYKWFRKWVKHHDQSITTEIDQIYYDEQDCSLSQNGQVNLHLLLIKQLQLKNINYEWRGMLLVRSVATGIVQYVGCSTSQEEEAQE